MRDKVLVVDDEPLIADIVQFNLEKEGYDVICAFPFIHFSSTIKTVQKLHG